MIEQEKINSDAQLDLAQAQQKVAEEDALIELAKEISLAKLYAENPSYVALQITLANAQAIRETDKLVFTPDGVFLNLVFNNSGTLPTFDINE